ncbi:MAG: hypothetical protein KGZ33_00725 [Alkaliphilus sp.]|nr:hypothetical protein [Alkaliphilus sp.]
MAKNAIEAVREAEEKAKALLSDATQISKNKKQEAELLAEQEYMRILAEGEAEAKVLKQSALSEGEAMAKPIIGRGTDQAKALYEMKDEDLNSAVSIIIERIVNANGNS